MTDCTWFPWCADPAMHEVERRTPDGPVLRELVCKRHLRNACDHGFTPAPAPHVASPDDTG